MWFGGCHLTRDTADMLQRACGGQRGALFASVDMERFLVPNGGWAGLDWLTAPHVAGVARKADATVVPARQLCGGTSRMSARLDAKHPTLSNMHRTTILACLTAPLLC